MGKAVFLAATARHDFNTYALNDASRATLLDSQHPRHHAFYSASVSAKLAEVDEQCGDVVKEMLP